MWSSHVLLIDTLSFAVTAPPANAYSPAPMSRSGDIGVSVPRLPMRNEALIDHFTIVDICCGARKWSVLCSQNYTYTNIDHQVSARFSLTNMAPLRPHRKPSNKSPERRLLHSPEIIEQVMSLYSKFSVNVLGLHYGSAGT
ncbi:hypothetical protein BD779DRAFT_210713 [Infundibulicybe gibba]|nr:hypothetical protein BD779DRAFT_210713 [Infundibulicybe gibba]